MGIFSVPIEISDIQRRRAAVSVNALVDTGAITTVIPASVLRSAGIVPTARQTFQYADGRESELEMAQANVRVDGRETVTWVAFGEDEAVFLLGAYTLEGVFMKADPVNRRLEPARYLPL